VVLRRGTGASSQGVVVWLDAPLPLVLERLNPIHPPPLDAASTDPALAWRIMAQRQAALCQCGPAGSRQDGRGWRGGPTGA